MNAMKPHIKFTIQSHTHTHTASSAHETSESKATTNSVVVQSVSTVNTY